MLRFLPIAISGYEGLLLTILYAALLAYVTVLLVRGRPHAGQVEHSIEADG